MRSIKYIEIPGVAAILTSILLFASSYSNFLQAQPADSAVIAAIKSQMIVQEGVSSYEVNVGYSDRIVTLTGEVDNLMEKKTAERVAKTVRGVQGVINRLEVRDVEVNDTLLEHRVQQVLLRDPATDSYELQVSASDGVVTISGTVGSYQERELIGLVIRSVKGVKSVSNQLQVDVNPLRTAFDIKQDILKRIKWDARIDEEFISVDVQDSMVLLAGRVGNLYEKELVIQESRVVGVDSVNAADLSVVDWLTEKREKKEDDYQLSDEEIKEAVRTAFEYDPRVKPFDLTIDVDDGVVTLSGLMTNLKARRTALRDARNIVGVIYVDDQIVVEATEEIANDELVEKIKTAFKADPVVTSFDIVVSARSGTVTLAGVVENNYEKDRAEVIASGISGVAIIENKILTETRNDTRYIYDFEYWNPYLPDEISSDTLAPTQDNQLKKRVVEQMFWSPFVDKEEIEITVENGIVTLTGRVDNYQEKKYATINAYEAGAESVINKLFVVKK